MLSKRKEKKNIRSADVNYTPKAMTLANVRKKPSNGKKSQVICLRKWDTHHDFITQCKRWQFMPDALFSSSNGDTKNMEHSDISTFVVSVKHGITERAGGRARIECHIFILIIYYLFMGKWKCHLSNRDDKGRTDNETWMATRWMNHCIEMHDWATKLVAKVLEWMKLERYRMLNCWMVCHEHRRQTHTRTTQSHIRIRNQIE